MKKYLLVWLLLHCLLLVVIIKKIKKQKWASKRGGKSSFKSKRITILRINKVIEKDNPFISYDYDGNRVVKISPSGRDF